MGEIWGLEHPMINLLWRWFQDSRYDSGGYVQLCFILPQKCQCPFYVPALRLEQLTYHL